MRGLVTMLLLGAALLGRGEAAEIDSGATVNYVLGSSGTMDSDFIFSFCPNSTSNCLPSPVVMTAGRVRVTVQNGISDVAVQLSVTGPGAFPTVACSGPSSVGPGGGDFSCLFPTALTESRGLAATSAFIFSPLVTFTPGGRQNGSVRFFVETSDAQPIPEPASVVLVGGALALCLARRWKAA